MGKGYFFPVGGKGAGESGVLPGKISVFIKWDQVSHVILLFVVEYAAGFGWGQPVFMSGYPASGTYAVSDSVALKL